MPPSSAGASVTLADPALAAPTGSVLGQWADWLRLIYLRRWLVASILAVGVFAALWSSAVAERGYDATVTLYIAPVPPNVVQYQQVVDPQTNPYREEFWYGTQYALLRSQPLLRRVADRLSLWDRPELLGPADRAVAEGSETSWVLRAAAAARELLARWRPAGPAGPGPADVPAIDPDLPPLTPRQRAVVGRILLGIAVTPLVDTRLVRVRMRLGSPQLAHDVALALAREYIAYDIDHRTSAAREAVDWIAAQIEQQRAEVAAAEAAVVAYRSAHPDVPLGGDTALDDQGLVELQEDLNEATTARIARRAAYRQVADARGDLDRLVRLPALTAEPVLQNAVAAVERLRADEQRLAETFGGLHPELVQARADVRAAEARLRERVDDLVAGLRLGVEVAEEQEGVLRGMLRRRLSDRVRAGRVTVEHASLARSAEAAHAILGSLTRRLHETQVMADLRTTAARIAEPPVLPQRPSVPRTLLRLQLFVLASMLGAFALVVLLDQFDARVRTPDDARAFFDQPTLAVLPYVDGIGAGELGADAAPLFQTAVQGLRTRLLAAGVPADPPAGASGPVVVIVTSAEPSDGKSVVVTELATSFARARRSVLLVDGDLRRARLHHRLDRPREPGLVDIMRGEAALADAVAPAASGLPDLLPAGAVTDAPTEVIQQFVLDGGFARIDLSAYQWVFIDAPPVLPVADALLLAGSAALRLFVVDTQRTPRSVVRTALDSLAAHSAPVSGVVLNKVDLARHPRYYGRYYRSYYDRYYTASAR